MRRAVGIEPHLFIEADSIDHQCVAFPVADRVAVVSRFQVFRMAAAIEPDFAEVARATGGEHIHLVHVREFDELGAVGSGYFTRTR